MLDQTEIDSVTTKEHISNGTFVFACFHMHGCLSESH